ncbi:DMT family transporter [Maribacter sp. 2210JD10-5]|uniref:DMT family transporter n=1 Tax=Maribacter sp. 2210JD10-5 TaxID=3386272 RepID=UPI0039BCACDB
MFRNTSEKGIGVLFAILGVVLFSAKAILVKLAYKYQIDHLTLLLFRMVFALPFYIAVAFRKKPIAPKEVTKKDYLWIFIFGFLGYYLASLFDFMGLQYLKAGLERIILFVYPTIVVLLSWLFFKKRLSKIQTWAIIVTYLGIIVTFWDEIGLEGNQVYWGAFLILLSAITYASYLVGSGWLIPKFGVLQFTSYAMIVSTLCVMAHYCIKGDFKLLDYPIEVYYLSLSMAIFSTLLPSFLVSGAIKRLGANTFSIFGSLGPISTIIFAYLFLNEEITWLQFSGIIVVIFGVLLVTRKKS